MQSIIFIGFALIAVANAQHLFSDNTAADDLVCGSWERTLIDEHDTVEEDITFNITDHNTYFGVNVGTHDRRKIKSGSAFVGVKGGYGNINIINIMLQTTSNFTRLEKDNTTECVFAAMVYSSEHKAFALTGDVCKNISTGEITALMHAVHQNTDPYTSENTMWTHTSGVTYYKFTINHADCGEQEIGFWNSYPSLVSRTQYYANSTNVNIKDMDFRLPTYTGEYYDPYNVNTHGLFFGLVEYSRPEMNPNNPPTDRHVIFGAYHGWDMYELNQTVHVVIASTFYTSNFDDDHINTISFGGQLKIGADENITTDLHCNLNFFRYDYCEIGTGPENMFDKVCEEKNAFLRNQVIQERFAEDLDLYINPDSKAYVPNTTTPVTQG